LAKLMTGRDYAIHRMSYYVILRGPLGVGKTAVSRELAKALGARHVSIDRILDQHHFWNPGRLSEFLEANRVAVERAHPLLERGVPVVFDGNFYWKTQIDDLTGRLGHPHFVFTLMAPLRVCIERDSRRDPAHGSQATREVFAKSTKFAYGATVDASRPLRSVVRDITRRVSAGIPTGSGRNRA
jgi:predicted kinase